MRTAGFSLAYALATAIFGGFTPAIGTWLIHATGNRAMPGAWVACAAACGLAAASLSGTSSTGRAGARGPTARSAEAG